jgi:glycosyltransferase involved in cell wall biosynthesis
VKIAMIGSRSFPAAHGGLEVAVENLSRELARRHEVEVWADRRSVSGMAAASGVDVRLVPAVRTKHLHTLSQTAASTIGAGLSAPDIVHFHGVGPGVFSSVSRFFSPTVVTVQGIDWEREKWGPVAGRIFGGAARRALGSPDAVIAVSVAMQGRMRALGINAHYVPNGVHVPAGPVPSAPLAKWGLEPDGYLLFASRIVPEKGLDVLLAAYKDSGVSMPLVVAGSGAGSYADDYERSVREDSPEGVRFVGYQTGPSLAALFAHCRGFILPSFREGLPLALLEAMSHGCTVVHSAIPECDELTRGDAGVSVPPRDVVALRRVLIDVVDDHVDPSLGAAARRRVSEEYSWDAIAARTEEIYGEILRP